MNSESQAVVEKARLPLPNTKEHRGSHMHASRSGWKGGVARILTFFVLIPVLAFALDRLIKHGLRCVETSEMGALNQVMSGKVNSDIIISGSSRALVHYDPHIIQVMTGRSAFNIARNASRIDVQLAFLKTYLNHNVKPQIVVQNLDFHTFGLSREIPDPTFYAPYLQEDELYSAFRKINPDVWKWKYVPLYCFTVEDSMFTWTCGFKRLFGRNPAEDFILGYNPRNRSWTGDFARWKAEHPDGDRVDYEAGGVEALTELVAICKQQGIEVVLVFSPVYYEGVPMISNRAEIFAEFATIAKRFDIPFWDYSESPLTREKAYFYNSQHMNSKGAALFSHDLAERLATVIRSKGSSRGSGREAATGIAESSKQKR